MSNQFRFEFLQELTETSGVPGYEDRVRTLIEDELAASTDRVETDAMGNVVGTIEGDGEYSILVAAHMDEIGFMVRAVDEDGFVWIDTLGGWDPRVLRAQRVTVHAQEDDYTGVIGSTPPHALDEEERKKPPEIKDIFVDVGMDGDAAQEAIAPGDLITMEQSTIEMGDLVTGKALDDRICLFAMLEVAREISDPAVTIHFAATVQEEVGLRGAQALGVDVDPDLAIALDVTMADDIPGTNSSHPVTELGAGTAIKLKDSSVITSPKVHQRLQSIAKANDIDHQFEILPRGGTDTAAFQIVAGATPVGAISIPTRYLHTVTEAAHQNDLEATIDLLFAFLEADHEPGDYTF